jgi:DNA adenine methylase
VSYFPAGFNRYLEPFIGSGAVLATLAPERGLASDSFAPLIEIWKALKHRPDDLKDWYSSRWHRMNRGDKLREYERVKASYNRSPNAPDLLFISRTCYGGVLRFRKADGYISTPCGAHKPMPPQAFNRRVDEWHKRVIGTDFEGMDYRDAMGRAQRGDMVYCDPPYTHTQAILYGAQSFELADLMKAIASCKARGAYVALSIDGTKKTGSRICDVPLPKGLFEREVSVNCGRSMLKRFQMPGESLEQEVVHDRLLLTY